MEIAPPVAPKEHAEEEDSADFEGFSISVRHGAVEYDISLDYDATLEDLRAALFEVSRVPPERQKLLGSIQLLRYGPGMANGDAIRLSDLGLPHRGQRMMLIGTANEHLMAPPPADDEEEQDDLLDASSALSLSERLAASTAAEGRVFGPKGPGERYQLVDEVHEANRLLADSSVQAKLNRRITNMSIHLLAPARPGKKLLVIDIDYTIYDMKSPMLSPAMLKRPYTDEFLTWAFQHFELCFWSQTAWNFLEAKLTELGILTHPSYRVLFVLDRSSMFSIESRLKRRRHEVKALQIIWSLLPEMYGPHNTLHIDDLSRNFALNPRNGIKIKAYKHAAVTRHLDMELVRVQRYLEQLLALDDFSVPDHSNWRQQFD